MPKLVPFLKYWAPVIAWIFVIFIASGDLMSAEHTSRFLVPFLRWIAPDISLAMIASIQSVIRKSAHVAEYAILAALLRRAFAQYHREPWRAATLAFFVAAVCATLDEFHQSFIPSRTGAAQDVVIDCCGAMIGLGLYGFWLRRTATAPEEESSGRSTRRSPE